MEIEPVPLFPLVVNHSDYNSSRVPISIEIRFLESYETSRVTIIESYDSSKVTKIVKNLSYSYFLNGLFLILIPETIHYWSLIF